MSLEGVHIQTTADLLSKAKSHSYCVLQLVSAWEAEISVGGYVILSFFYFSSMALADPVDTRQGWQAASQVLGGNNTAGFLYSFQVQRGSSIYGEADVIHIFNL